MLFANKEQEAWEVARTAKSSRVTSSCVQKRDEKMRRTLIPGRRDGRQWVAGRGVSTSQPSGRVTVRPTRQDLYQSRARKVPVAVSREGSLRCWFYPLLLSSRCSLLLLSQQVGGGDEKENGRGDHSSRHHIICTWSVTKGSA